MHENEISAVIVDAAIEVHRTLGPGLLESVYVLRQRGLAVQRQVPMPIVFNGIRFDEGFRADLIVNGLVLVELKSVERLAPVHRKQVLTRLRLSCLKRVLTLPPVASLARRFPSFARRRSLVSTSSLLRAVLGKRRSSRCSVQ